jgi:hypothetical protein
VRGVACKQTACRHCGQDIEGFWPYRAGEWRDRGNNAECPYPINGGEALPVGTVHAPERGGPIVTYRAGVRP